MSKFVISGRSDCPYFAKSELLADVLYKSLQNFQIKKEIHQPDSWESWPGFINYKSDTVPVEYRYGMVYSCTVSIKKIKPLCR